MPRGDLTGAWLSEADLTQASLVGATLTDATLYRADLTGANLSGANLAGAQLDKADLVMAGNLTQQQLDSARGDDETKLPAGLQRPAHWSIGPAALPAAD